MGEREPMVAVGTGEIRSAVGSYLSLNDRATISGDSNENDVRYAGRKITGDISQVTPEEEVLLLHVPG